MRILVVGDSYVPTEVFKLGLGRLQPPHDLEYIQIDQASAFQPRSESELRLREFAGSPVQIVAAMTDHEVLVVHGAPITEDVLEQPSLRLVCCARGGPVNVDTAAAIKRGIPVVTTPGKNAEAVADQTIAFMIMLARRFPKAQRFLLDGNQAGLTAFEGADFLGHDLRGHTLGLVGFGNVGTRVAERARAFGMDVVVYDPFVEWADSNTAEWVETLDELLARSNFVSVHARASNENRRMFDTAAFSLMRPGSYFINTARESLVDEHALEQALSSGHLGGAALDVVEPQTGPGRHPLLECGNVVITPHIGGATHETLLRGVSMIAEEIERFAAGEELVNVANRSAIGT